MAFEIVNWKFIAAGAVTAAKTLVYRMTPTPASGANGRKVEQQDVSGETSVGVHPVEALGKFFETSLSLGKTESANELKIDEAVLCVSQSKNIVKTQLVGLAGSIKEYINTGDYEISISVGLVATDANGQIIDEYPTKGVEKLRELFAHNEALYVNSAFLRLFDVTRLVIEEYSIQQMTHSNRQIVTIKALSDEDYVIKCNEY